MHRIGVLTCDIVNSTKLGNSERDRLLKILNEGLSELVGENKYEIYRGDSIQILLNNPEDALSTAIQFRCLLRKSLVFEKFYIANDLDSKSSANESKKKMLRYSNKSDIIDARVSIGIGKKGHEGTSIKTSDGEAFHLSGRALDKLKSKGPRLILVTSNNDFNDYMNVIIGFLDGLITNWSIQQSEVVFELLKGKKQKEIACLLNISQASISQRISSAKWQDLEKSLALFKNKVNNIFLREYKHT